MRLTVKTRAEERRHFWVVLVGFPLPDVGGPHEGPRLIHHPQAQAPPYRRWELGWHPDGTADRTAAYGSALQNRHVR